MKKLGFLMMPIMAISLLASCNNGGGDNPLKTPMHFTCLSNEASLTVEFKCEDETSFGDYYLEYSTNNKTWQKVNVTLLKEHVFIHAFSLKKNDVIYFRSDDYQYRDDFHLNFNDYSSNGIKGELSLSGNVLSLLSKTRFGTLKELPNAGSFIDLFFDNKSLVNASELLLPATKLTDGCYCRMFDGCAKLVTPPKLPATTLTPSCYSRMFEECDALTSAPYLPAAKLVDECYFAMFDGDVNLHVTDTQKEGCVKIFTCPSGGANCCEEMFTTPGYVNDGKTYYYIPH